MKTKVWEETESSLGSHDNEDLQEGNCLIIWSSCILPIEKSSKVVIGLHNIIH